MDKKPKNSTSIVAGAQQTNHSECHPEQMNKGLCSHKGCPDAGSHTKRSSDQAPELHPAKIAHKSPDLDNSEGTMQNERNITVKVSSTVEVGEVLRQLVQEIKEMRAQLQGVSADISLQGGVLGQIRMDSGCRVCWGNMERCCGEAAANKSNMEESQSPPARPFYNF